MLEELDRCGVGHLEVGLTVAVQRLSYRTTWIVGVTHDSGGRVPFCNRIRTQGKTKTSRVELRNDQAGNFRAVSPPKQSVAPLKISCSDRHKAQSDFHTSVFQVGCVGLNGADTRRRRRAQWKDKVFYALVINGSVQGNPAIQKGHIQTEFDLLCCLRNQIGIYPLRTYHTTNASTDDGRVKWLEGKTKLWQTTGFTIGTSQFQLVEKPGFHEIVEVNGKRCFGESVVFLLVSVEGGFIEANTHRSDDLVVPVEVFLCHYPHIGDPLLLLAGYRYDVSPGKVALTGCQALAAGSQEVDILIQAHCTHSGIGVEFSEGRVQDQETLEVVVQVAGITPYHVARIGTGLLILHLFVEVNQRLSAYEVNTPVDFCLQESVGSTPKVNINCTCGDDTVHVVVVHAIIADINRVTAEIRVVRIDAVFIGEKISVGRRISDVVADTTPCIVLVTGKTTLGFGTDEVVVQLHRDEVSNLMVEVDSERIAVVTGILDDPILCLETS